MSATSATYTGKSITHVYVRDAQKAFLRPCWRSEEELYCGMCMRATIRPVVGEVCPTCGSTVERILEIVTGGTPKPAQTLAANAPIRVGIQKQKRTEPGVLLDFLNSREAGA